MAGSGRGSTGGKSGRTPIWAIATMAVGTLAGLRRRGHEPEANEAAIVAKDDEAADSRGRSARSPGQIPARGWKDILYRTYEEFSEDRLMLVAAGLTFYVLLSVFPGITAFISIYGLFSDPSTVQDHLQSLRGVLPASGLAIIGEQMQRVASRGATELGIGLVFGLGVALWSANSGMKSFFDALNIVYQEKEKRSFIKLTLISLGFTLSLILFLAVALGAVVVLPIVLDYMRLGGLEDWLLLLRWPVLLLIVTVAISIMFRFGPSRRRPKWRWVTWGSALAAILWVITSFAFSFYVENFGNYDETYGSLGAAIGFMTWIWVSWMVLLLGAELNAEMEHQTARDSTDSHDRPMGSRGAYMADTIGETKG